MIDAAKSMKIWIVSTMPSGAVFFIVSFTTMLAFAIVSLLSPAVITTSAPFETMLCVTLLSLSST